MYRPSPISPCRRVRPPRTHPPLSQQHGTAAFYRCAIHVRCSRPHPAWRRHGPRILCCGFPGCAVGHRIDHKPSIPRRVSTAVHVIVRHRMDAQCHLQSDGRDDGGIRGPASPSLRTSREHIDALHPSSAISVARSIGFRSLTIF